MERSPRKKNKMNLVRILPQIGIGILLLLIPGTILWGEGRDPGSQSSDPAGSVTESIHRDSEPPVRAQAVDTIHRLVDFVDLPEELSAGMTLNWYLEFNESWIVDARRGVIAKMVQGMRIRDAEDPRTPEDSLQALFQIMVAAKPLVRGRMRVEGITYEFSLLDPHLVGSGVEPADRHGNLDAETGKLQSELIDLAGRLSSRVRDYPHKERLLSFYFHETWTIHPVSLRITKRVEGITPVVWQRRETVDGLPIDDAETGLPVYYKNAMERIPLRNP